MSPRYCLISDGDSRLYLCPLARAEEGRDALKALLAYWEAEETDGEAPGLPDWLREIEGEDSISFCDPQDLR